MEEKCTHKVVNENFKGSFYRCEKCDKLIPGLKPMDDKLKEKLLSGEVETKWVEEDEYGRVQICISLEQLKTLIEANTIPIERVVATLEQGLKQGDISDRRGLERILENLGAETIEFIPKDKVKEIVEKFRNYDEYDGATAMSMLDDLERLLTIQFS